MLRSLPAVPALLALALVPAACAGVAPVTVGHGPIHAVGAESQYADVVAQVGGRYVTVTSILSSPSSDPHEFELSPRVARAIGEARLVVQNGLGYDSFMGRIESAQPNSSRRLIDVARLPGVPSTPSNPHVWYAPGTMPAVTEAVSAALSSLDPPHAAYYRANAARLERALARWRGALGRLAHSLGGVAVATTEPVADYMLEAAGLDNLTPAALQAAVMDGLDPAPQNISREDALLSGRRVAALLYNRQVTDTVTQAFVARARAAGVPVVAVSETMPRGQHFQSWMNAELGALERALTAGPEAGR